MKQYKQIKKKQLNDVLRPYMTLSHLEQISILDYSFLLDRLLPPPSKRLDLSRLLKKTI